MIKSYFSNRNTTFMTYNLMHLELILKNQEVYSTYGNAIKDWKSGYRWGFQNPEHRQG